MKNRLVTKLGKDHWGGFLFTAPAATALLLLVAYPLFYGMYISFFDTNLVNRWEFIGIDNYKEIFSNMDFTNSILLTLLYTVLTIAGHFIIGIGLALLLNQKIKGIVIFRAILVLPWLLPEVVVALLWKWLFNPMYGLFNHFLLKFDLITEPISWLGESMYAFIAVVMVSIWKGYPLIMLMMLAGLQSISKDLYEAARIDGTNKWQEFRYITIPGLKSVLVVSLILDTVWWFKHYTMIWIMTAGGPGNATNVVSIDIFKNAFEFFDFGNASAMAVIVFSICFLIGFLYRRVLDHD
jgi:multiple sugar transport system permease protein